MSSRVAGAEPFLAKLAAHVLDEIDSAPVRRDRVLVAGQRFQSLPLAVRDSPAELGIGDAPDDLAGAGVVAQGLVEEASGPGHLGPGEQRLGFQRAGLYRLCRLHGLGGLPFGGQHLGYGLDDV